MLYRTIKHLTLAAAMALSVATAAFAQDGAPNVNQPPAKPDSQQPPNVNQPPNKTQEERQRERQEERQRERDQQGAAELPASFHRAGDLMGMTVETKSGEKIGELRNLAINTENGRIRYAIVDRNGTLHPIPMPAVKFANRQRAVVDTTLERMKDAPTFKGDGWNTIGDANWGKVVFDFYGIQRDPDYDRDRPDLVPAAAVVGARAETRKGDNLGVIRNLMIDTEKNVVAYDALEVGGSKKLFAVPWQATNVQDGGKKVVIRGLDRDDLKDAPGFPNGRWPTYKELGWNNNTNFDSRPPEWVYGYKQVNNGGGGGGGGGNKPGDGGDHGVLGGWQTHSKYGELFRPNRVERWAGTVVRTDNVTPMNGMDPGTALVVKTQDKGNIVVHLGPEWYIRHQQDKFTEGERIDVTGSQVDLEGKPIVMATQVRLRERTMYLRSAEGYPVWDSWQERK